MNTLIRAARRLLRLSCLSILLSLPGLALAHHSFAMFDSENQLKMTGTVTRFDWTNPHVYIELDVTDADGTTKNWTIECANISILSRIGWKFNIIKPGDELTVIVGPLRSGEPGALLKQVTLADGTKMGNGTPAGAPNIE